MSGCARSQVAPAALSLSCPSLQCGKGPHCHWLVANIPADFDLSKADTLVPYRSCGPPLGATTQRSQRSSRAVHCRNWQSSLRVRGHAAERAADSLRSLNKPVCARACIGCDSSVPVCRREFDLREFMFVNTLSKPLGASLCVCGVLNSRVACAAVHFFLSGCDIGCKSIVSCVTSVPASRFVECAAGELLVFLADWTLHRNGERAILASSRLTRD